MIEFEVDEEIHVLTNMSRSSRKDGHAIHAHRAQVRCYKISSLIRWGVLK